MKFNDKETHPSYAMLSFCRTSGGWRPLFGTSIQHQNTIRLTLKTGSVRRDLNTDWYFGGETLFEVEMSYNQFAELIGCMNMGDGIPVTLRRLNGELVEDPPFVDKKQQHENEFGQRLESVMKETRCLIDKVKGLFASKKTFNRKEQEDILKDLTHIEQEIGVNSKFALTCFQEQMDKTVIESKSEVEAFVQNKMHSLALESMREKGGVKAVFSSEEGTPKKLKPTKKEEE